MYWSWALQEEITFPLLASNSRQWPELSPAANQDGEVEALSVCALSDPQEHMVDTSEEKLESADSPLQRWSFCPRATSINLQARVNAQKFSCCFRPFFLFFFILINVFITKIFIGSVYSPKRTISCANDEVIVKFHLMHTSVQAPIERISQ